MPNLHEQKLRSIQACIAILEHHLEVDILTDDDKRRVKESLTEMKLDLKNLLGENKEIC